MCPIRLAALSIVALLSVVTGYRVLEMLLARRGAGVVAWTGTRPDLRGLKLFSIGLMACGAAFGLVFLVALSTGVIKVASVEGVGLRFWLLARFVLIWAVAEEIAFRLLALNGLVVLLRSRWQAIAWGALLFGALHACNPSASLIAILGNALGGVLYGAAYLLHRSIWLPIGLHVGWNLFQGPVFGFPVSGNDRSALIHQEAGVPRWFAGSPYGPEADPLGFLIRLLLIAMVVIWWRRTAGWAAAAARDTEGRRDPGRLAQP